MQDLEQNFFVSAEYGKHIVITKEEIPWMNSDGYNIHLVKITTSIGQDCYIGSMIGAHKILKSIASRLTKSQSENGNIEFYQAIQNFLSNTGDSRNVSKLNAQAVGTQVLYIKAFYI